MRILAMDPGGTTGVTWGYAVNGHFKSSGFCELNLLNSRREMAQLVRHVEKFAVQHLVVENFILYPGGRHTGGGAKTGLSPVAVTYLFLGWLDSRGLGDIPVTKQLKVAANVVTKEYLRANGLWFVGAAHARDAAMHAELFARRLEAGLIPNS